MTETAERSVLARIIAAHEGRGPGIPDPTPSLQTGMTRAIRRAAMPFGDLKPRVEEVAVARDVTLPDVEQILPEHGLLAAIEDQNGRRGLVFLEHGLVDALIEVQTTGAVEEADLPPRPVTKIDEALSRDFLDLFFGAFALEVGNVKGRDWPQRMSYGSHVPDPAQLSLLFPPRPYHHLTAQVTVGASRKGRVILVLPVDVALAREVAQAARAKAQEVSPRDPVAWQAQMLDALGSAPLSLDAILFHQTLPLGRIEALAVGDLIPFEREDLSAITLQIEEGPVVAKGSLGQSSGRRAVRLSGASGAGANEASVGFTPDAASMAGALSSPPEMGLGAEPAMPALPEPTAAPAMAGFDPQAPMPAEPATLPEPGLPAAGGFDPNAPMGAEPLAAELPGAFDPNAPMDEAAPGLPDLPMGGGFDPNAPMGDGPAGMPDLPMAGGFDPNAPMG